MSIVLLFILTYAPCCQTHWPWHLKKHWKLLVRPWVRSMKDGSPRWLPSIVSVTQTSVWFIMVIFRLPSYFMIWCCSLLSFGSSQARYKYQLDPTVEEVKRLCNTCRKFAKTERVLFHYNGHGVPKPTTNGEIWLFNRVNCLVSDSLPFQLSLLELTVCFNMRLCRVILSTSLCQSLSWIPG